MARTGALAGKVALVTGSSRGLGRAIALRLATDGADTVVNFVHGADAAEEVAAAIRAGGGRALTVQADVSRVADIDRLFQAALAEFGRLDIVVANAGVEKVNIPVAEVTEESFDTLFRINTKGPYFVLQAAARHVADGGRIINLSSSSTARPQPGLGLYGTSKSAPNYLVRVLALELGRRGITVNSLLPGPIEDAGIFAGTAEDDPYKAALRATVPLGRLADAGDVAGVAAFLAGDAAAFVNGQDVLMNGGSSN